MLTLSEEVIAEIIAPYLDPLPGVVPAGLPGAAEAATRPLAELLPRLQAYLELLLVWNSRTNLTSIREPQEVVRKHFGESLYAASVLRSQVVDGATLLDYGSGAGFPGLPLHLLLPNLAVTLSESQGKKAAFLREAVRVLETGTHVWGGRVEAMPSGDRFEVVALRAVDRMQAAAEAAMARIAPGGTLMILTTSAASPNGLSFRIPGTNAGQVQMKRL